MQGDFTRWTFSPEQSYRGVLMQQGRVLLDAEWNEQAAITAWHDETRTRDLVGRTGGPAPVEGRPGPFCLVDLDTGKAPVDVPWEKLAVTGGRYYVDGVVVQAGLDPHQHPDAATDTRWPLTDQPYLATIPAVAKGAAAYPEQPGLPDPAAVAGHGRYLAYLDVWSHHVTADEQPALLESALGGADTTTREQTVWQVRVAKVADDATCASLAATGPLPRLVRPGEPVTMSAELQEPDPSADPCRLAGTGGYQRLENQLYRVQLHDVDVAAKPRFLWSRENASVTARLLAVNDIAVAAADAALTIDRQGRDAELSFGPDDLIEVTSTDRQLRGLPGVLAHIHRVDGLTLIVTWLTDQDPVISLAQLGRHPIVRRWEGGPTEVHAGRQAMTLEDGIVVRFEVPGTASQPKPTSARPGDHWLIPARTARLAYGISALHGTVEWPVDEGGNPLKQPPVGPVHHLAPLALLEHTASGWSTVGDCRALFPSLTDLTSLDLVGGDGQEGLRGQPLPHPVRVVVRRGGQPVAGVPVRFTASAGKVSPDSTVGGGTVPPGWGFPLGGKVLSGRHMVVTTGSTGVAAVHWTLGNPEVQTLTAQRLDDAANPVDAKITVSARLRTAASVVWTPSQGRHELPRSSTVADALDRLVKTRQLRLLGGDGQESRGSDQTLPAPVRVVVDSPFGPIKGAKVVATAAEGARVLAIVDGDPVPGTLTGVGGDAVCTTHTDEHGVAAFAWQPGPLVDDVHTLRIKLESSDSSEVRVHAQKVACEETVARSIHVRELLNAGNGKPLLHDESIELKDFKGVEVVVDDALMPELVNGKPVCRVLVHLPWPEDDRYGGPIGTHAVALTGEVQAEGNRLRWTRTIPNRTLNQVLDRHGYPLRCEFQLDGWAVGDGKGRQVHAHTTASAVPPPSPSPAARVHRTELTFTERAQGGEDSGNRLHWWFWLVQGIQRAVDYVELAPDDVVTVKDARGPHPTR